MGKIKVTECGGIKGLKVVEPTVFGDARGYFMETYNYNDFKEAGIDVEFVQDNQSSSHKGVLRGLHFQINYPQDKLVRVVSGEVFDVAVDLREGSETYGKWFGVVLSAENKKQFFIPKGFAHGFLVLSEHAEFVYKCSDFYHPNDEGGLIWNDPDIGVEWPIPEGIAKMDFGACVTPKGIPTKVVSRMVRIIPPGIFLTLITSRITNPITATITEGDARSPKDRQFFASFATISPQFFAPRSAINRPIPALTDCFRLTGITRTTASLSPKKEIMIKRIPLQKITPAAMGMLTPSLVIIDAMIPTLPSPGANANGRFVISAIAQLVIIIRRIMTVSVAFLS